MRDVEDLTSGCDYVNKKRHEQAAVIMRLVKQMTFAVFVM